MQSQATPNANTPNLPTPLPPQRRLNPLVGAAAVAVVIASLTAVAAVTGVLPISKANQGMQEPMPVAAAPAPAPGSTTRPPVYDDGQTRIGPQAAMPQQYQQQQQQAAPRSAPARQAAEPAYGHDDARSNAGNGSNSAYADRQPAKGSPYAGRVVAVTPIQTEKPASGLGAVGGAVVGGLLGNQVGKGNGRIVGTVVGAVGGGFAGNQIEKTVNKDTHYQVRVKMDDGSHRTFTYQSAPGVQVGERVHLENGALVTG
jgi:outer membrane lipoprotein SlyB